MRGFAPRVLSTEQIGQLCWAGQGITDEAQSFRTAPSAGALHPISLFVANSAGLHAYEPRPHALRRTIDGDIRAKLQAAALDQPCIGSAPLCFIVAMDVDRSAAKYGGRAERYCLLEAGHVAQNVLLQATALGLGGVPVGAFDDRAVARTLHLAANLRPVYLIPVGYPEEK